MKGMSGANELNYPHNERLSKAIPLCHFAQAQACFFVCVKTCGITVFAFGLGADIN